MNNETRTAVVRTDLDGLRLDRALSELFPDLSRSFLAKLIDQQHVRLGTEVATKPSHRVAAGQPVTVEVPPAAPSEIVSQVGLTSPAWMISTTTFGAGPRAINARGGL